MKINNIKLIAVILVTSILSSCIDDNFEVPNPSGNVKNQKLSIILGNIANNNNWNLVTISDLKSRFNSGDAPLLIEKDDVVKGYVVSSDRTGNFFQEIYIQDAPENPVAGIKVVLNLRSSYTKFNIGREVYIHLNGLYLGETNSRDGVTAIGGKIKVDDPDEIDEITENQIDNHILRSSSTETIVPKKIRVSEISNGFVSTFVRVEDAFFPTILEGKTIVDPNEDFDTQRTLSACNGSRFSDFILETSSFASFSSVVIQTGRGGTIDAIVTKDFGGDNFVVVVNDIEDIDFNNSLCQIDIPVFNDNFDNLDGWTSFNVTGSQQWNHETRYGNSAPCVRISGFANGRSNVNEDWLISKAIDLSAYSSRVSFSFESIKRYNGSDIEVYFSTNYNGGNPNTDGTWTQLNPTLDTDINNWNSWTNSGNLDASVAAGGSLFIAFKYISTSSESATFQIDNIELFAN